MAQQYKIIQGPSEHAISQSLFPADLAQRPTVRFIVLEEETGVDYDVYGFVVGAEELIRPSSKDPNWLLTLRVTEGCSTTGRWSIFKCHFDSRTRKGVINAANIIAV